MPSRIGTQISDSIPEIWFWTHGLLYTSSRVSSGADFGLRSIFIAQKRLFVDTSRAKHESFPFSNVVLCLLTLDCFWCLRTEDSTWPKNEWDPCKGGHDCPTSRAEVAARYKTLTYKSRLRPPPFPLPKQKQGPRHCRQTRQEGFEICGKGSDETVGEGGRKQHWCRHSRLADPGFRRQCVGSQDCPPTQPSVSGLLGPT